MSQQSPAVARLVPVEYLGARRPVHSGAGRNPLGSIRVGVSRLPSRLRIHRRHPCARWRSVGRVGVRVRAKFPGCVVMVRAVGLLRMRDEKGPDNHVVCVPCADPGWDEIRDIEDLAETLRAEIGHFFSIYKDLDPGPTSEVDSWGDRADAVTTITAARTRCQEAH